MAKKLEIVDNSVVDLSHEIWHRACFESCLGHGSNDLWCPKKSESNIFLMSQGKWNLLCGSHPLANFVDCLHPNFCHSWIPFSVGIESTHGLKCTCHNYLLVCFWLG